MDLNTIANIVIAVASIITILVAVITYRNSTKKSKEENIKARYVQRKAQACLVDAWVALEKVGEKSRYRLVLQNEASVPIRNVSLVVESFGKIMNVPSHDKEWYVLPPGSWIIERNELNKGFEWGFPRRCTDLTKMGPVFIEATEREKRWRVISLQFTDAYGDIWRREFIPDGNSSVQSLQLVCSCDKEIKKIAGTA